jgi:retron-type reverse transcriptase
MKSYKYLFEKLISYENLSAAIEKSSLGKKERREVKRVLDHKDEHIKRLQDLLINQKLRIRKHEAIKINDGITAKVRLIIKPDYVYEQILHHAIVQVLTPIFMRSMYVYSCGSLPGRGGLYGKRYLAKYIRENPTKIKYVAKGDITKFFQTVNIELVKDKFRKIIHDEKFLQVLFLVLDSNIATYQGQEINMGLPIGYYLSQWIANWFLQDFDYFIKQKLKIKCYIRYVDDFVLLSPNKKELHKALAAISEYLNNLDLRLKPNYQVFKLAYVDKSGKERGRPIDFMGYKFYRDRTILRRGIMLRAVRKALKISKKTNLNWYECTQLLCYLGWFKYTDTYKVYERFIKPNVNIGECKKVVSLRQKRINKRLQNEFNMAKIGKFSSAACA